MNLRGKERRENFKVDECWRPLMRMTDTHTHTHTEDVDMTLG